MVEEEEEEVSLIAMAPMQSLRRPQPSLAAAWPSRRWTLALAGALLALLALLSWHLSLQRSRVPQLEDDVGVDDSTSAATVDFQAWVLDTLQPLPPRLLHTADPFIAVEEDGVRRFRQGGENYAMGSLSSRLQRLPLLSQFWDDECRFTFNPTILDRRPPTHLTAQATHTDSFDFHLSTQLGSYAVYRDGGNTKVVGKGQPWRFAHVLQHLRIDVSDDRFQLRLSDARRWQLPFTHDVRLLHHKDAVVAYDNLRYAATLQLNGSDLILTDRLHTWRKLEPVNDEYAKNFMAASVDRQLYYVQQFSPFILVGCGDDLLPTDCVLLSHFSLSASLLPKYHTHWRGSTTLLPLPSHPHLLLGLIHERSTSGRDHTRDVYFNRFVVVDSHRWIPFAFTPPFGLFANVSALHWFEFILSFAYLGTSELVLTLGYNDQEPWLCILPLHGVIRALQPVLKWQQPELSRLKADYNATQQKSMFH